MKSFVALSIGDGETLMSGLQEKFGLVTEASVGKGEFRLAYEGPLGAEAQAYLDGFETSPVTGLHVFAMPTSAVDYSALLNLLSIPGFQRITSVPQAQTYWSPLSALITRVVDHPETFERIPPLFAQLLSVGEATEDERQAIAQALPEGLALEDGTLSRQEGWT